MNYTEKLKSFKHEILEELKYINVGEYDCENEGFEFDGYIIQTLNIRKMKYSTNTYVVLECNQCDFEELPVELQCELLDWVKKLTNAN